MVKGFSTGDCLCASWAPRNIVTRTFLKDGVALRLGLQHLGHIREDPDERSIDTGTQFIHAEAVQGWGKARTPRDLSLCARAQLL